MDFNQIRYHSQRVYSLCEYFIVGMSFSEKHSQILLDAAELHDMCKLDEKHGLCTRHEVAAANEIEENHLAKHRLRVADVVLNHKGKFSPEERNWEMAAILRLCDKLDKFDKGDLDAEQSCETNFKKIESWCRKRYLHHTVEFIQIECIYRTLLELKKQNIL